MCTGNVVANGRKWTIVEEEYDEREAVRTREPTHQMDEDGGKMGWEKRREAGGGSEEKREREKGDTFITRRRATEKIERQVVFTRGSLPGPRGEHEEGTEGCDGCTNGTRGKEGIRHTVHKARASQYCSEIIFYAK